MRLLTTTIALAALTVAAPASARAQSDDGPYPVSPKRPSFSVGSAIAPGSSLELEFGVDTVDEGAQLPTDLRLGLGFLKRTELSVSYDSLDVDGSDARFGEKLTLGLRSRLIDAGSGPGIAFAPEVGIGLRDGVSDTIGAVLIADRSFGRHGLVANLTLEGPIDRPEEAPSHTFTWVFGYSLVFGRDGRFGAFAEVQQALPQGESDTWDLMQGITCSVRSHFMIDLALQQSGVGSGSTQWHLLAGLTKNFGKIF